MHQVRAHASNVYLCGGLICSFTSCMMSSGMLSASPSRGCRMHPGKSINVMSGHCLRNGRIMAVLNQLSIPTCAGTHATTCSRRHSNFDLIAHLNSARMTRGFADTVPPVRRSSDSVRSRMAFATADAGVMTSP